jgi:hypothetical protein
MLWIDELMFGIWRRLDINDSSGIESEAASVVDDDVGGDGADMFQAV